MFSCMKNYYDQDVFFRPAVSCPHPLSMVSSVQVVQGSSERNCRKTEGKLRLRQIDGCAGWSNDKTKWIILN